MPKLPDTLYTDRGLEFVANPLKEFYAEKGIKKFETSSKKKAAVAERAIRTLKTRLYKVEKKYKERLRDGQKEML
uniref:Integrase catalytic domain-containing protein n=1 Tax=Globodera pallida TaxID=36090 RepID=A0A183CTL3_GLOPA